MFLDYSEKYTGGTYQIFYLHKKCIVLIWDVIWILKIMAECRLRYRPNKTPPPWDTVATNPISALLHTGGGRGTLMPQVSQPT